MKEIKVQATLVTLFSLLLLAVPALAHHSFSAEFDGQRLVTVKGVLTKVDWINPHVYLYVDAKNESGKATSWVIETWPTGLLHKAGISRNMFVEGQAITIVGYPAKDGTKDLVYIGMVTLPDGRQFDLRNPDRRDPADPNP